MKNVIKPLSFKNKLFVSLIFLASCVTPADFANNYSIGSYLRFAPKSVKGNTMNYTNIKSYTFSATIDEYKGTEQASVNVYFRIGKKRYLVKNIDWGTADISVTGLELAQAVNSSFTSAQQLQDSISLGTTYRLTFVPVTADNEEIVDDDQGIGPDPAGVYRNINTRSMFRVVCPVDLNQIAGTYVVTRELFGYLDLKTDDSLVNVIFNPEDSTFAIPNYPRPKFTSSGAPIGNRVDSLKGSFDKKKNDDENDGLTTGAIIIEKIDTFGKDSKSGPTVTLKEGDGSIFTCDGQINISLSFSPGGDGYTLTLRKKE